MKIKYNDFNYYITGMLWPSPHRHTLFTIWLFAHAYYCVPFIGQGSNDDCDKQKEDHK